MAKGIRVHSGGYDHGNTLTITVDGHHIELNGNRGIGVVIVEKGTRHINHKKFYDTYQDASESTKLANLIHQVKQGNIIVMGIKDEGSHSLSDEAKSAIASLGSHEIHHLGYRDSWALIARKGKPGNATEVRAHHAVDLERHPRHR